MARILIVDDRADDRYLLQQVLRGAGHEVDAAGEGGEALELARRRPPDLVTSDVYMPGMDGFALCRAWREDEKLRDIPFIFYSATYTDADDASFARSLGADRFLAKPMEPVALLAEIQVVLAAREQGTLAIGRPRLGDPGGFERAHDQVVARKLDQKMAQLRVSHQQATEAEAKFRALVEQSLAGIFMVDREGRFTYANPRLAEILGCSLSELRGREVAGLLFEEDRERARRQFRRHLAGELPSLQEEFRCRRKDGARVDLGVHSSVTYLGGKPVVIGMAQDVTERNRAQARIDQYIAQLERAVSGTIQVVSRIVELRDPYTAGHERRVGDLAAAIGREMGLADDAIRGLRVVGLVHDVGKISTPAELLSKPGRLTPVEFQIIKTHPEQGHDILKLAEFPWPVSEAVLQHHERLDGSGYPRGLAGDAICLEARIIAVADVVEAMASHRPYRVSLGLEQAVQEIEQASGRLYDAEVAGACLRLVREKGFLFE